MLGNVYRLPNSTMPVQATCAESTEEEEKKRTQGGIKV